MAVHYSASDSDKNPLYFKDDKVQTSQFDKIKIVIIALQGVTLLIAAVTFILAIVIVVKPFIVTEDSCTSLGGLTGTDGLPIITNCSLSPADLAYIIGKLPQLPNDQIRTVLSNISRLPIINTTNCSIPTDEIGWKIADILNKSSNHDVQNSVLNGLTQLLQLTNDLSTSIAYIKGLGDDQAVLNQNQSDKLDSIIQSFLNASDALNIAVGSLSSLQTTTTSTAGVANDILLITEDILDLTNRSYLLNYVNTVSCNDILRLHPNSSSGYYHINSRTVYCEMEPLCGSAGWTRIAYFDAKTESCPSGFRTYASGSTRACGRNSRYSGGCSSSLTFDTGGVSYTQVCGRATGIQYGSPDTINNNDINSHYIDGLALTRGSPREHVWSFIAGLRDTYPAGSNCPCNSPPGSRTPPSFVGSDYFCESGNHGTGWIRYGFYASDPLWDGQGCGSQESACCAAAGLPWFHKDFGNTSSTDFLELRVCGNSGWNDEDVPFANYEFYIK